MSSNQVPVTSATPARRTASKIYDHIFDRIASGEYAKGERLPTETELADLFKVSRTVVREALARLRDDGLLQSRQGAGSFILVSAEQAIRRFAPVMSIGDIQRCYEFRMFVEEAACGLAALRRTEAELSDLLAHLRATENISDVAQGVDTDLDFHLAIAAASHNRFFVDTLVSMRSHMTVGMELTRKLSLTRPRDALQLMYAEHQVIYDAIAASDVSAASAAMRRHLEAARKRVFEG